MVGVVLILFLKQIVIYIPFWIIVFRSIMWAKAVGHASSNNKTGKRGEECILRVPVGTIVWDFDTELLIRDLNVHAETA